MKERPILFSGSMVRALLDGRKTQTRRVVNDRTLKLFEHAACAGECFELGVTNPVSENDQSYFRQFCPYGQLGDRLYVRETHEVNRIGHEEGPNTPARHYAGVKYQADDGRAEFPISNVLYRDLDSKESRGWTPSIHMPRWVSRITLEVTGVRVERLQDISVEDAEAEGCKAPLERVMQMGCAASPSLYRELWDSLNAARGYGWDVNPWVWVVEFKRISHEV